MASPRKTTGFVYFIQAEDTKAIKIGFSKNVEKRRRELQGSNASPLTILGSMPGTPVDERAWHDRFRRHRLKAEWFRGELDLLEAIAHIPPLEPESKPVDTPIQKTGEFALAFTKDPKTCKHIRIKNITPEGGDLHVEGCGYTVWELCCDCGSARQTLYSWGDEESFEDDWGDFYEQTRWREEPLLIDVCTIFGKDSPTFTHPNRDD